MNAINELYELTVAVCDNLYGDKRLITKSAVKKLILAQYDRWSNEQLELQLPQYINQWRLNNLQEGSINVLSSKIKMYKSELENAYKIITLLKNQIKGMLDA